MCNGGGVQKEIKFAIDVPEQFSEHIDAVVVRVGYLYPNIQLKQCGRGIHVSDVLESEIEIIKRDILYALYREKIYSDTIEMRDSLLRAVIKK